MNEKIAAMRHVNSMDFGGVAEQEAEALKVQAFESFVAGLNHEGSKSTITRLEAQLAEAVKVIERWAKQPTTKELEAEYGEDSGDYEGAYDAMVRDCRAFLASMKRDSDE